MSETTYFDNYTSDDNDDFVQSLEAGSFYDELPYQDPTDMLDEELEELDTSYAADNSTISPTGEYTFGQLLKDQLWNVWIGFQILYRWTVNWIDQGDEDTYAFKEDKTDEIIEGLKAKFRPFRMPNKNPVSAQDVKKVVTSNEAKKAVKSYELVRKTVLKLMTYAVYGLVGLFAFAYLYRYRAVILTYGGMLWEQIVNLIQQFL